MFIGKLHHVQLAMPPGREDEARAFYRDVLGISEVAKPKHLQARGGVWFEDGDVRLHLGVQEDFRPATKAHPALEVEQLDELVLRCRLAGCRVTHDEPLTGYERVYVYDPFGNRLELLEPHGPMATGP